jgi:hypothetical protein
MEVDMNRRFPRIRVFVASVPMLCTAVFASTAGATALRAAAPRAQSGGSTGIWSNAEEVPGSGSLNVGGDGVTISISCTSAGNCGTGGQYSAPPGDAQGWVGDERNGTWDNAEAIPGLAALNVGGSADPFMVSCTSAGNCAAGGLYADAAGHSQAFVVVESNGSWGTAEEVPGSGALNAGGFAIVNAISCTSSGNCAAGGYYTDGGGHPQAFVTDESHGTWGAAEEVPGSGALNVAGNAAVNSISCASPGDCAAGGSYTDGAGHSQAFVVDESNDGWGAANEVPGSGALNAGGNALIGVGFGGTGGNAFVPGMDISCTSPGDCSAGGGYTDSGGHMQAFVVDEKNGRWGNAEEVPGSGVLDAGGFAAVSSLSCSSTGNCAAGGTYTDGAGFGQAFVVDERDGRWQRAEEIPGSEALNAGGGAFVNSISCASLGNCAAGGGYLDGQGRLQAFVADESKGTWGTTEEVPGSEALNAGGFGFVLSVSCVPGGNCLAGGFYLDTPSTAQAFVTDFTPAPTVGGVSPGEGPTIGGTRVTIHGTNLTGAQAVSFGPAAAAFTVDSPTAITATTPPGAGAVDVIVTTAGGTSTATATDRFTYIHATTPNVSSR